MRRLLDTLYNAAGYLAAFFLVLTLAWVVVGIAGRNLNFYIPGTDAYAGYAMAACGFLALAHTLKCGEHIRVELFLQKLTGRARKALQLWALGVATLLAGLFAFYSAKLAWQSYLFNDRSTGNDASPLWIPQLTMVVGTLVLFVAFVDEFVLEWRGQRTGKKGGDAPLHNE